VLRHRKTAVECDANHEVGRRRQQVTDTQVAHVVLRASVGFHDRDDRAAREKIKFQSEARITTTGVEEGAKYVSQNYCVCGLNLQKWCP